MRCNGQIELNSASLTSTFILNRNELEIQKPANTKGYINHIGAVQLDDDLEIVKAYVYDQTNTSEEFILEFGLEKDEICSVKLLQQKDEIIPESLDDIHAWLEGDEEEGIFPILGAPDFNTPWEKSYDRVIEPERMEPLQDSFKEQIYFNENSIHSRRDVVSCTYIRNIINEKTNKETAEYLQTVAVEENNTLKIKIYLGLEISPTDITI